MIQSPPQSPPTRTLFDTDRFSSVLKALKGVTSPLTPNSLTQPHAPWDITPKLVFES